MSLTQLKDQAAHLASKEQRELIAFLVALQTARDEEFKGKASDGAEDRRQNSESGKQKEEIGSLSNKKRAN